MMDGIQVILGRDWLDTVHPLVDWRSNSLVLRNGNCLEVVQGVGTQNVKSCNIIDRGLPGLQHAFTSLNDSSAKPTEKWGEQLTHLSSPRFWGPKALVNEWVHVPRRGATAGIDLPRAVESPQGEVPENFLPNDHQTNEKLPETNGKGVHRKRVKVAGRIVSQPVRQKIDFVSVKRVTKLANKTDSPMFLCLLRPKELLEGNQRKIKAKAGAAKGQTEGEKRRIMKKTGPIKIDIPIGELIHNQVQHADKAIQGELKEILEEYKDVFPRKLPYGPLPKRVVDHEIETAPGETPPHKKPIPAECG